MPSCYVEVTDNEMEYLDGGIDPISVAGLIIAAMAAEYGGAYAVGIFCYQELGYRSKWWHKAIIFSSLSAACGPIAAGILYVGFINGYNSCK